MFGNPTSWPWLGVARLFLIGVLAFAAVSVLLDGSKPALAAGECQYGPYGPYGPYGQCPKAKPTLRLSIPGTVGIGATVVPQVTIANGDNPTGQIFVRIHRPGEECANPLQPPFWVGSITVNGNGSYFPGAFSTPPPLDRFGVWRWSATYIGDARNELVSTVCGDYTTEVTKRTPVFFLGRPFSTTVGSSVTVFGSVFLFQPSATVTLRLFDPADPTCSGAAAFTRNVASSFTETFGPLGKAGTWRFVASYPGDANNNAVTTPCNQFPLEVTKAVAFLTPFVSSPNVRVGQTVSAGASLFGSAPTGTLSIRVFEPTDPTCSEAVQTRTFGVAGNGVYALPLTPNRAGTWRLTVSYPGDDANIASVMTCGVHRIEVAKATPTLALVADPTTARKKDVLNARVTVDGAFQATGSIRFHLFGPDDPACTGTPAYVREGPIVGGAAATAPGFEVPKDQVGRWNWTATYDGDHNNTATATDCGRAPVEVEKPGTNLQRGTFVFAANTDWQSYSDYPKPGEGGSQPTAYGAAQKVCLSAAGCPADATDYGSPFGGAWTSNLSAIPGAAWIWRPGVTGSTPNADFDQAVFSTRVVFVGRPIDGWIEIAADDFAEVRVNGELVGSIGQTGPAYGSLTRLDLMPFLKPGANTISVLARNGPWCGTCPFSQNPAGVVFGGAITVG